MRGKPLSSYILICEKLMQEKDNVYSAIRLADIFYYGEPIKELPLDKQAVAISVLTHFKVPSDDDEGHAVVLELVRPSGERTKIFNLENLEHNKGERKAPGSPRGFSIALQLGVIAKEMGVHEVVLSVDGEEQARTWFTLATAPVQQSTS